MKLSEKTPIERELDAVLRMLPKFHHERVSWARELWKVSAESRLMKHLAQTVQYTMELRAAKALRESL